MNSCFRFTLLIRPVNSKFRSWQNSLMWSNQKDSTLFWNCSAKIEEKKKIKAFEMTKINFKIHRIYLNSFMHCLGITFCIALSHRETLNTSLGICSIFSTHRILYSLFRRNPHCLLIGVYAPSHSVGRVSWQFSYCPEAQSSAVSSHWWDVRRERLDTSRNMTCTEKPVTMMNSLVSNESGQSSCAPSL